MTCRLNRIVPVILVGLIAPVALAAQEAKVAPSPAGAWNFVIDSPHGKMTAKLDLKVDASGKVTGTLTSEQLGKREVSGKFAEGRLAFAMTSDENELSFAGKMKDADTFLGTLTGHGDMACTATRIKPRGQPAA